MVRRLFIAAVIAAVSHAAVAAEAYVCVPEKSTGFTFNKTTRQWDMARFDVDGKKYFVRNGKGGWQWLESEDSDRSPVKCSDVNNYNSVTCTGFYEIVFNRKSLRFQKVYAEGYVTNPETIGTDQEGAATPYLEIGTCAVPSE
jgi:hypothetical protein